MTRRLLCTLPGTRPARPRRPTRAARDPLDRPLPARMQLGPFP